MTLLLKILGFDFQVDDLKALFIFVRKRFTRVNLIRRALSQAKVKNHQPESMSTYKSHTPV